jgi:hypothetical protein
LVAVPPTAPPPFDVEEVPGGAGLVAEELVPVLVGGGVVLDDVELLEVVGELLLEVLDVLLEVLDELLDVLELLQSWAASWATVLAPWLRF